MKTAWKTFPICFLSLLFILALPLSCRAEETSDTALNVLIQEAMASDGASAESCAVKLGTAFRSDSRFFIQTLSAWDEATQKEIAGMVVYDQNGPHNPDFQLAIARLSEDASLTDAETSTVQLFQSLCAPTPEETPSEPTVTEPNETVPPFSPKEAPQPPQPDKRPLYWALGLALFGIFFAIFALKGIRKL